jgi:hypothetical protein
MTMEMQVPTSDGGQSALLHGRTAEVEFCRSLPWQEPIAAQVLLCGEVSRLFSGRKPDRRDLGALLVFDRYSHQLGKRLLLLYAEGDAQLRSLDREFFIAAQRLSRSFSEAYEGFLEHIRNLADGFPREHARTILIHLFRHRQLELLLRLFRYKKRNSEQWRQLHAIYTFAQAQGLANDGSQRDGSWDGSASGHALEQQFIQILLLGAMGTGQFSPRELLWARDWIGRWHRLLTLRTVGAAIGIQGGPNGFVVDLQSAEGLKRCGAGETGEFLYLDTAPLAATIEQELAALNDRASPSDLPALPEQESRRALLCRLGVLFAPKPGHIERRGEREPVDLPIQAISSLSHIVQVLREERRMANGQSANSAMQLEDITISPTSGHTRILPFLPGAPGFGTLSTVTAFGARINAWQIKDRSDSGCRMRGQTTDLNGLIPGALITLRENEGAQWTVAVVRRLRRLMVDRLEISVEYIGRRPRFVKMMAGHKLVPSAIDAPNSAQKCFGALYLPASEKNPSMPIKTLLVPAGVFNAGRYATLLSSMATYSLRLNKPIEQQSDYVWTTFTVLEKAAAATG